MYIKLFVVVNLSLVGALVIKVLRSGAETNLKVGAHVRREVPENFGCPSTFLAKVQSFVLASAFVMSSTVWSFLVYCSSTQGVPCAAICKSVPVSYGIGATGALTLYRLGYGL